MKCLKGEDRNCSSCKDKVFNGTEWFCIGIRKPRKIIVRTYEKQKRDNDTQKKEKTRENRKIF